MGADIHLYVEKKLRNGEWAFVRDLNESIKGKGLEPVAPVAGNSPAPSGYWRLSGRNYELFGKLAGVRREGPEPKGLPADVSDLVGEEYLSMGSDAHSASWSTPLEFMEAYIAANQWQSANEHEELNEYLQIRIKDGVGVAVNKFMFNMCSLDIDEGEYRFVYWFDN